MKILRTGAGSPASEGIIKELEKEGIKVIRADADANAYSRYLNTSFYRIPFAEHPEYIEQIETICLREQIDFIIPACDEELMVLSKTEVQNKLASNGTYVMCSKNHIIKAFHSKTNSEKSFKKAGIKTPRIWDGMIDADYWIEKNNKGSGSEKIKKVHINDVMVSTPTTSSSRVVQEYIEGDEYSVDFLCFYTGKLLCGGVRKRTQVESGICLQSEMADKEIAELIWKDIIKLTDAFQFIGPINAQCILKDGIPYWIDVNPRFGGSSVLTMNAGTPIIFNLVEMLKVKEGVFLGEVSGLHTNYKVKNMRRFYNEVYF